MPTVAVSAAKLPAIYAAVLVFGFAVGVLSGRFGIGGGVVFAPGLVLLFGLSPPKAQGAGRRSLLYS